MEPESDVGEQFLTRRFQLLLGERSFCRPAGVKQLQVHRDLREELLDV